MTSFQVSATFFHVGGGSEVSLAFGCWHVCVCVFWMIKQGVSLKDERVLFCMHVCRHFYYMIFIPCHHSWIPLSLVSLRSLLYV
jgi:hypothetical protein